MAKLSTILLNGDLIQLDKYSDVKFVVVDGVLLKYNGNDKNVLVPTTINEIYLQAFEGSNI